MRYFAGVVLLFLICCGFMSQKDKGGVNIHGTPISKEELSSNYILRADLDNFVYDGLRFTVTKFNYTFVYGDHNKQLLDESVSGNMLPNKLRTVIKDSRPGNILLFYDMIVKGPTGDIKVAQGPVFTVE